MRRKTAAAQAYEPLITPESWKGDELRFSVRLTQILDSLFARLGAKLGKTEKAADSAMLGGKAPEYYLPPRNLLDNSDFTHPVNQRGKTSYNAVGYTIDRWRVSNQYAIVNVGSGYVEFKASGGTAIPRQIISTHADMFGKTYTAAVCTGDGIVRTVSGTLTAEATGTETTFASGTIFTGVTLRLVKSPDLSTISFRIDLSDGRALALKWAAVYEGSYTEETLPRYSGREDEWSACMRYFQIRSTGDVPACDLRPPMHRAPNEVKQLADGNWGYSCDL